ncbi:hypothetical protein [Micromonospora yangpuensis]|uniref:Uncharacterized protein n=1 Tax=Micromonospora yangpuensis TaxID=683228 RepID=A0A1C6VDM7_9ACTN|nr:hypothetical protein [Micromonospora yangpuensis]GGM13938.1 hypothetical protein GCM10012279_35170 [Micromonospora yangpuensis]SCL64432.1 hypothetical protein GA0070617_5472 [Micromonospora yangpuensis]
MNLTGQRRLGLPTRVDDASGGRPAVTGGGGQPAHRDDRAAVVTALRLGWWLADAFHQVRCPDATPRPGTPTPGRRPHKLSNFTEMPVPQRMRMYLDGVDVALTELAGLTRPGRPVPSTAATWARLDAADPAITAGPAGPAAPEHPADPVTTGWAGDMLELLDELNLAVLQTAAERDDELAALGAELRDQGELWRGVLTGGLHPRDLLDEDDYAQVARNLIIRDRRLVVQAARGIFVPVLVPLLAVLLVVVGVSAFAASGSPTTRGAVALVGLGAGLAAIWRSVSASALAVAGEVNRPLVDSELTVRMADRLSRPLHRPPGDDHPDQQRPVHRPGPVPHQAAR